MDHNLHHVAQIRAFLNMRESWALLPSVAVEKHSLEQTINGRSKYEHLFFLASQFDGFRLMGIVPTSSPFLSRWSDVPPKCSSNTRKIVFAQISTPLSRTTVKSVFAIAGLVNALKDTK